jgi:hypothetical protein
MNTEAEQVSTGPRPVAASGPEGGGLSSASEQPAVPSSREIVFEDPAPVRGLPWMRKIRDVEELKEVARVAKEDGHGVIAATHLIQKQGEVVGYASIGAMPVVFTWLHSKKVKARETVALLNTAEALAAANSGVVCVPCMRTSPLFGFMEKFGYKLGGDYGLFFKRL